MRGQKIWVWAVDGINWDTVKTKKIWAVDNEQKKKKIEKDDIIIFYVAKTNYFQGIFKVVSEWEEPTTTWPDGRIIISEIKLEQIETGFASINKIKESLGFVKNDSNIGIYLMGVSYGPSNFGKPISQEDYNIIKNEMSSNKTPAAISKEIKVDSPEDYNEVLKNSPIRLHLIKSLFDNLMGPKKGPGEEIENVNQAYSVGILRTKFNKPVQPVDPEPQELEVSERSTLEELVEEEEEKISPDYDLNPILGARSFGMSFLVNGANPKVRICATWGRYERSLVSKKTYRRQMNYFVTEVDITKDIPKIIPEELKTKQKRITKKGMELEIITNKVPDEDGKCHVSIFLINNTPYSSEYQSAEEAVFQPQIRVNLTEGKLDDLGHLEPETESEKKENALFATRRSFGRGHFCGVLWKDVDPEDFEEEGFATFNWPDSKSKNFEKELVKEFTRPHIRTEFFPTYSILQPDIYEKSNITFSADEFSNEWNSETISQKLSLLVTNYRDWISKERERASGISSKFAKDAAEKNLQDCIETANRIEAGIQFLKSNEDAKMAFCFMNKAIHLKTQWDGMKDFGWWEFQMAFILQCIRGVAQDNTTERDLCDILWFPTGGGKTEAYLGLTVFSIIYRRLQDHSDFSTDGGVTVISRYTLRLLTLQQFQRSLGAIVASDFLRVNNWIPEKANEVSEKIKNKISDRTLWGTKRISIGLLIGSSATPNRFKDYRSSMQAEGMLRGRSSNDEPSGEPAQVLNCPCCKSILAVPTSEKIGLDEKSDTIHWIFSSTSDIEEMNKTPPKEFSGGDFEVKESYIKKVGNMQGARGSKYFEIKIIFEKRREKAIVSADKIRSWWNNHVSKALSSESGYDAKLASTEAAKPGYFYIKENGRRKDFAIYCPNSDCKLNSGSKWFEGEDGPMPSVGEPFKIEGKKFGSVFMPISAYTVDEQIYRRCPTMIISTVDKFAQMPFKEDFASIFGNVDEYHPVKGYGRNKITEYEIEGEVKTVSIKPFLPPSLIIQDELHLIEGPLGSMVGVYELAIDILSSTKEFRPKYIASSATIKEAKNQVGTIFRKNASIFPPQGITVEDNYFSENKEDRKSKSEKSGRVYMGICAPQKILALPVRIWATLLSEIYKIRKTPEMYGLDKKFAEHVKKNPEKTFDEFIEEQTDGYWTLIGYFNAIKDLQIARSLYDDDIRRDVKKASQQSESSTEYQTSPVKITRGLRFFPIMSENDMDITGVTVYCNNSRGAVSMAVFENTHEMKPGKIICNVSLEDRKKSCSKGENEFELEKQHHISRGDIVWIGIANDSEKTSFESGFSSMESLFANTTEEELKNIHEKYEFPETPETNPENTTVRITMHSEPRKISPEPIELTGNTESQELPSILKMIDKKPNNKIDCVFTTAVFGTGIDISRLGLMAVMGQPKTTSSYIQSTGRVGRNTPGLVVTNLKSTNIRDLNHYENFTSYHRMIQRFVEPITASPFAEESLRSCLGPVLVSILRNGREIVGIPISKEWVPKKSAPMRMKTNSEDNEIEAICSELKNKLMDKVIPNPRRAKKETSEIRVINTVQGWKKDARNISKAGESLQYFEWTLDKIAENNVVLGSPQHELRKKITVFKNVRTSMREVEATSNFGED